MIDPSSIANALAQKGIVADESQQQAIDALCALLDDGRAHADRLPYRGVYCHGLPGRGKSLIVDTVYALATCTKRRLHFHQFIRDVNRLLVQAPKSDDRLGDVSRAWLKDIELLYFDEFHVHDIADAFLMGRFLETVLACGTRIVLTSNYSPRSLLPDPEFHERFEPTIERIEQYFDIVAFDGERDYREQSDEGGAAPIEQRFFAPLDGTREPLWKIFSGYEAQAAVHPTTVEVAGRLLPVTAAGKQLVWVDFDALCGAPRSHLDYLALAERWGGMIVDRLETEMLKRRDVLQRFVWLVDIFYDRKHALFITSDQPIRAALAGLDGAHDVSRTTSRLAEMQSRSYANSLVPKYLAATPREEIG
ncbi:cell division protein ZapE [Paraburkholderia sacchari]|uniref:Cell division protein ZapE n=1 Tax=Paraburkholderia sacchari TaxID=159450 RepID=A0A8T6ZSP8_9BURK|nr:cell division protein ZapE [Paraburkholderia sacchari]NLP65779.1 cell division protein ZapE [Paraburkholderia sacchari]